MPKLHPALYQKLPPAAQMRVALIEGDPRQVWSLLQAGQVKPAAAMLSHAFNPLYLEEAHPHIGPKLVPVAPQALAGSDMPIYGKPYTPESLQQDHLGVVKVLFNKGVKASTRYSMPGPCHLGPENYVKTTAAQEAFAFDAAYNEPNLPAMAAVVLQTLAEEPGWKPDTGYIFRNLIGDEAASEPERRQMQAEHIGVLGRFVSAQLDNPQGEKSLTRFSAAASAAMTHGQKQWWKDAATWQLDHKQQPYPSTSMRTVSTLNAAQMAAQVKQHLIAKGIFKPEEP